MASIINATTTNGVAVQGDNSGSLQLQTNNGTTAITIDSSQNVGIGTTSPSQKLDVTGNARLNASSSPVLQLSESGTLRGSITGSSTIGLYFQTFTTTPMRFDTNGSERMRITSGGDVGIGTTTPDSYGALAVRKGVNGTWLGVSGNSSFQTSDAQNSSLYVVHSSANSGTTFIGTDAAGRLQMFCSSSASGGVYLANGGTSWTSASDERVKENLVPIENGLAKVASLRAVTGNYIKDETKKSKAFLIAQDVEAILPEAVDSSNPDELGLAYTDVIPLLVASIKELKAELDATKAEVQALKGVA